ncbi:MAG: dienelactone hydrolase family protein [Prosthecobacter sp.]
MHLLPFPLPCWLTRLLLALGLAGCTAGGGGGIEEGTASYESGGQRIKVETFFPAGEGRHPAVLVLYGSGGALVGKSEMTDFAKRLAANGMAAYVVHYFNRTGTLAAGDAAIDKHWRTWLATVKDGVSFVSTHPRARADSIGMFGYSLGAYLAVAGATMDNRIRAVAEIAGGIFDELRGRAVRFPPTLVLHGNDDERVPVARVQGVLQDARRLGTEPEVKIYPGEGHRLSPAALQDASDRALRFLKSHL